MSRGMRVRNPTDGFAFSYFMAKMNFLKKRAGPARPLKWLMSLGAELFLVFFFYSFGIFFGFCASSIFPWFSSIFPWFSSMFP